MLRRLLSIRLLAVVTLVAVMAVGGWFWYRGSSLVKIRQVAVTGLSGPDVQQIRGSLEQTALAMTTLNLNIEKLEHAVQAYPEVSSVTATTHGSHGVTIGVVEKIPVAQVGSSLVDVGGYVLPSDTSTQQTLPQLKVKGAGAQYTTSDGRVTGAGNLQTLMVLAAAPYKFLSHVSSATYTAAHGVVVKLHDGPDVYFGGDSKRRQKWTAALAVIGSSGSAGASYIDVTDPQRPAAGGSSGASTSG